MSERSKETDSKSVMWLVCIEGSNPPLSVIITAVDANASTAFFLLEKDVFISQS